MRRNAVVSRLLIALCCVAMAGIGANVLVGRSTSVFAADTGASDAALTNAVQSS